MSLYKKKHVTFLKTKKPLICTLYIYLQSETNLDTSDI